MYGQNPSTPLDLVPLPVENRFSGDANDMVKFIQEKYEAVRKQLVESNKKYKDSDDKYRRDVEFQECDLVWINLSKDRFPRGKYGKLHDRGSGPYKILKRAGKNAYILELPKDIGVSSTFNVSYLRVYHGENEVIVSNLKLSSS